MIRTLYDNPRFVVLAIVLIVISGAAGLFTRPQLEDPKSKVRWGYITTEFSGASPSEVEAQVSEPIEQVLREAQAIRSLESSSLRGVSIVYVRLTDEVVDVATTWATIQDKLSEVTKRLPERAGRPILVDERRWDSYTTVVALVAEGTTLAPGILARWSKELENRLRFVPGTRFTELFGLPLEEVQVELSAPTLAETQFTIADVADAIRRRDAETPDATSQSATQSVPVRLVGDVDDLVSLSNIILRGDQFGRQLRLGDIARVHRSERMPPPTSAYVNGARAVAIGSRMDATSNINVWTAAHEAALIEFTQTLPSGIRLHRLFSQQKYTQQRSQDLYLELAAGMTLVVLVTGMFLGWRAAVPICASMPLAILMSLFLMIPCDISLHQMSIAGLIIALGVLDSNAIITVDDLDRRLAVGEHPVAAIEGSIRHLTIPLACSNILSILGFAPAYFLPGPTGEFLGQLCWAVNVSLACSVLLSLTIVPFLAVWFLKPRPHSRPTPVGRRRLAEAYRRLLRFSFQRPLLTIGVSLTVPVAGFLLAPQIQEQFFPAADRDHFHFSLRLPSSASVRETANVAENARRIIQQHDEVSDVSVFVGTNAPMVHYSMLTGDENRPNFAQGIVQLRQRRVGPGLIRELQQELEVRLPQAQVVVTWVEQGPAVNAPIEFRLYGPSLERLAELGDEARRILLGIPGIVQTRTSMDAGGPLLGIGLHQHEATGTGLTDQLLAEQLRGLLDGVVQTTMSEQIEEVPIRVRLEQADEITPEQVLSLPLVAERQGHRCLLPLAGVADWSVQQQLFHIHRRNGSRCNVVSGYVAAGLLPIELERQFQAALKDADFQVPPGYRIDFGGVSDERNSAVGHLLEYSAILLVLMIAVLVLTFHSFRLSALIGLVATLSIGLGLLTLWVFSYPIGLVAMIGILGMMGIAINDSIMVLDETRHAWLRRQMVDDVVETVFISTRHVVATTITAGAGVMPLIIAGGDFWPPLAIVIVGGVGGATVLALGLTPACFLLLQEKRQLSTEFVSDASKKSQDSTA